MKIERAGDAEVVDFINFPQIAPPAELGVIYSYRGELRIVTLYDEECWRRGSQRSRERALGRGAHLCSRLFSTLISYLLSLIVWA